MPRRECLNPAQFRTNTAHKSVKDAELIRLFVMNAGSDPNSLLTRSLAICDALSAVGRLPRNERKIQLPTNFSQKLYSELGDANSVIIPAGYQ